MNIPRWPVATERERELLSQVLDSGQWGGFHEMVARFERAFAEFHHCAGGVSAANGTVTLEMALEAAGVGPGDEVVVPAISFISTASAVSRVGATPVFVDIEELSFNMDAARAAAAVTPRTKAILAVHFGGPMADMERLPAL
ncbi:MAG: aminotransferase class I/II-fold pyridoxal phosphate-dependent enzyme, partial [Acidobacteria bacterium]|nr:aminotransferase class I/II-fold pyridoxal phosphate-dependent enzyme [Acidobacteriota bacterium]